MLFLILLYYYLFSPNKRTNILLQQNFNRPIVARDRNNWKSCYILYVYLRKQWVSSCAWISIVHGTFDRLITGEVAKNSWTIKLWHRGGRDDEGYKVLRENNEETIVHVQNRKNAFPKWDECRERWYSLLAAMDLVDVGFQDRLDTNNEAAKEMWIADAWHRPQSTSGIIDRLLQIQIVCLPSFLGLSTRTVFERCPSQACFDSTGYITLESFRIYFVVVVVLFFIFAYY